MKVFFNGHIYNQGRYLEAMVEDEGKICFIGDAKEAITYSNEIIDLKGAYVYPGFNDSHMHLVGLGQMLTQVNLANYTSSLKGLLQCLKDHMVSSGWLIGRGWNQDYFDDYHGFVTREHLDQVSTTIPIFITRACGHVAVVNSKAIELMGLTENQEGYDLKTGLFQENAIELIKAAVGQPTVKDIENYILKAQALLNQYGITSVQSDDLVSVCHDYHQVLEAYHHLEKQNKLTVRVYQQSQLTSLELLKQFIEEGNCTGVGSDMFKIGPLKLLGDGSLGARTALLSKPYHDASGVQGIANYKNETLNQMMHYAHDHGMQIAIHVIGDGMLDRVLDIYQEILDNDNNRRHGLVHVQITRDDQLKIIHDLQLHCYIQSIFLDYDNHIVEQRVGSEMADTSYAFLDLYQKTSLSNGSDSPVELPDVLKGMQMAVTRTSIDGTGPYRQDQALSRQQMLDSYTVKGSYSSFEESKKGILDEGYLCDCVCLSDDLFKVDSHHIKDIQVLATYMNGKLVYGG